MEVPIDKFLMQDYRRDMRTPDCPSYIDTRVPITPVKTIGTGFTTPNSKQKLRHTLIDIGGTSTDFQIATVTASKNVYLLGYHYWVTNTTNSEVKMWDAASGSAPSISANTKYEDEGALLLYIAPQTGWYTFVLPLPKKVTTGIRLTAGGASVSAFLVVYYIEEDV